MTFMPKDPTGGGLRKQRAAQLKTELDAKQAQAEATKSAGPQPGQEYTLQEGDTLQSIASQVEQDPDAIWSHEKNEQLREARGSPSELQPGDTLFIPEDEKGQGPVGQGDYVIKQGDCMASIAIETGHFWETIWNHPDNAELKEVRQDPNVLLPDDRVTIPEKTPKQESGETEERHRFVRKGVPETLIIHFRVDGEPRADQAYTLEVDGTSSEGTTDSDGRVEVFIPPNAKRGKITFRNTGDEYELQLGELDPVTEVSGIQARLRNLGFFAGPVDGNLSEELRQAVRDFQEEAGLEPTGELNDATRDEIQQAHGT